MARVDRSAFMKAMAGFIAGGAVAGFAPRPIEIVKPATKGILLYPIDKVVVNFIIYFDDPKGFATFSTVDAP